MSQYILINRIHVQNANAVAGFTWGFPAITHFMGFAHALSLKIQKSDFNEYSISGCGVVCHEHITHTYGDYEALFSQTKNPGAMHFEKNKAGKNPSIIEEGKMKITVSLLIHLDGFLGGQADNFTEWLKKQCLLQRLAGGTILDVESIQIFDLEDKSKFYLLKRKLLPGFALMDRSSLLGEHYEGELSKNSETELLDAWLDFSALKQRARPKSNLITKHLKAQIKRGELNPQVLRAWEAHLESIPYEGNIPQSVVEYFQTLDQSETGKDKDVQGQWQHYCQPTDKSPADWEYLPKASSGYLVPIMTGYKAISDVYENEEVANTRDNETPVCFVEAVHSIGEWRGVNRFKNREDIASCLWQYDYKNNWYLCRQPCSTEQDDSDEDTILTEILDLS